MLGLGDLIPRGAKASEMGDALPLLNLGTGLSVSMIAIGEYFSCAVIRETALLKCWVRLDLSPDVDVSPRNPRLPGHGRKREGPPRLTQATMPRGRASSTPP